MEKSIFVFLHLLNELVLMSYNHQKVEKCNVDIFYFNAVIHFSQVFFVSFLNFISYKYNFIPPKKWLSH